MARPNEFWTVDGTPIRDGKWKLPKPRVTDDPPATQGKQARYAVIVRFENTGDDRPYPYAFTMNGFGIDYSPFDPLPDEVREPGTFLKGVIVPNESGAAVGTLDFNVGVGHFETMKPTDEYSDGQGTSVDGTTPDGAYTIGRPIRSGKDLIVPISTLVTNYEFRLIAEILDNGKSRTVVGEDVDETSSNPIVQRILAFRNVADVKIIRSMRMQCRPMDTVFFDGFSLAAGQASTMRVGTRSIPTTLPSGVADEVDVDYDVRHAGVYALSDQLRTVGQLLKAAEVIDPQHDVVTLRRYVGRVMEGIFQAVPASSITPGSTHDTPLQPNDEIYVEPASAR